MWSDGIDLIHGETVIMLYQFLLFLSFNCFLGHVAESDSFLVCLGESRDEFPATLELYFHLCPDSLLILFQYLERLVQTGRSDCKGVVFLLPVEAGLEISADGDAVVEFHPAFFRLHGYFYIVILADRDINQITISCNNFAADCIYYL